MNAPTTTMLAYIPSPPQGVWDLGPFPLRAYALCIIAGIIVAVWWGNRRWVARGGQEGEVLDVAIWAVPFGLLGGRLYHLITDWKTYFGADAPKEPLDALRIWDGGLGIWGAVALGAVGAWIGARRRGIRLPAFGDAIAPPILLAQAIGRLGNYFNQELYGRETTLPWGLEIYERVNKAGYADAGLIDGKSNGVVVAVVQPTFLYELLWNVLIVVLLVVIDRKFRIGHGRLFALYIAGYCLGRFFIEMLRDDRAAVANDIAGIRPNLFTAALVFVCAIVYFVVAPKGREQGLEMYHPERAAELEEQGVAGYVDDWYDEDFDELDAAEGQEPPAEVDTLDALDAEADKVETTRVAAEPAAAAKVSDDEPAAEPVVDETAAGETETEEPVTEEAEAATGAVETEAVDSDAGESGAPESADAGVAEPEVAEPEVAEPEAEDDATTDVEATDTEAVDAATANAAEDDEADSVVENEDPASQVVESEDAATGVAESEAQATGVVESDPESSAVETDAPAAGDAESSAADSADVQATDAGQADASSSLRRRVASRFGRRRRP
ncbi:MULTISPECIES: prolipoprotein diacylglyceryl transferase [Gordonia]|uniref:Phosphatidylglycerol--prolipoprotein diacylglyceryl transferase n=2 Tax=Gordonia alkanivorans TaxID=84096 RepID=W9DJI3_9ACTN|nr:MULTISPECIES: prolipoprotein diacylglyceryl transferase [Gordonia]ETA06570.1 prolipoprotein diacylglyceryl transferase [Gordonia alkanivorans CGMCC 6845]MDH3008032.1 prolipoprotein diacylglyceryl transferase [Gordonia alkanivorans]MDH3011747.1 prolipoprotein diacylglyceryl transferase [Gordonia alkanivorans]MDH3016909.1 prolipoprotein diacylglyceryl transferase [Gordonia alkanivorans]MDH3020897.1 prolipoprotein diacylglyceryl transferase [Gordonia alkanivorans]